VRFLIDECLHLSLVPVAQAHGHDAYHVNWLGLSGTADWKLMARIVDEDFTFVTNNARDFRRLYTAQPLHAGLVVIVRQVSPQLQRRLFETVLDRFGGGPAIVNEVIEVDLSDDNAAIIEQYELPRPSGG
jgi:predicted nuclease of predicted toxin-antitoxin system